MQTRVSLVLLLFLVPTLGYTNCTSFKDVVADRSESTPPIGGYDVAVDGVRRRVFGASSHQMYYVTDDYNDYMLLIPWGYDRGGMRVLTVKTAECFNDPCGYCPSNVDFDPFADGESPFASRVSNGIFLVKALRPSLFGPNPNCGYTMQWTLEVLDQAGNYNTNDTLFTYRYRP